jgi:hypothetical protein
MAQDLAIRPNVPEAHTRGGENRCRKIIMPETR